MNISVCKAKQELVITCFSNSWGKVKQELVRGYKIFWESKVDLFLLR